MTEEIAGRNGFFNVLHPGRYSSSDVRHLDLYLYWRDGRGQVPKFSKLVNLESLALPVSLMSGDVLAQLAKIEGLRSLAITMLEGDPIPEALFDLVQLEDLSLASGSLVSLPDRFDRLSRLRELDL